jgi:hypothetical protein
MNTIMCTVGEGFGAQIAATMVVGNLTTAPARG